MAIFGPREMLVYNSIVRTTNMKPKPILFIVIVFFGVAAHVFSEEFKTKALAHKLESGLRSKIEDMLSPDEKYTIYINETVGIADAKTGEKVCEVIDQFANAYITAFWSKDSRTLIVIEHYARVAVIFIAQKENGKWNAIMLNESKKLLEFYKKTNADRIGSEKYNFAGWISDSEFKIHGVAVNVREKSGNVIKELPFEFNVKIADGKGDISDVRPLQK
jgi:hypothetical protein